MQHPALDNGAELWVIKIGGAVVDQTEAARQLLRQVRACRDVGIRVVLVHGGGQRLTALAERLGYPSTFVGGRRITDDHLIEVAKLVFAGGVGTDLAALAHAEGVAAVALSGVAAGLLQVRRRPVKDDVDFGWVGDVTGVDVKVLQALTAQGLVPLVASLGVDSAGLVYNVNADTVACALAVALQATRLVVLTAFDGVLRNPDDPSSTVSAIKIKDFRAGKLGFPVSGGMIPKLASLAAAIDQGVKEVLIASWHRADSLSRGLPGQTTGGTTLS